MSSTQYSQLFVIETHSIEYLAELRQLVLCIWKSSFLRTLFWTLSVLSTHAECNFGTSSILYGYYTC